MRVRGRVGFPLEQSCAARERVFTGTRLSEAKRLPLFVKLLSHTSTLLQGFSSGVTE